MIVDTIKMMTVLKKLLDSFIHASLKASSQSLAGFFPYLIYILGHSHQFELHTSRATYEQISEFIV